MMALLSLALAAVNPAVADFERRYERWERRLSAKIFQLHYFPAGADQNDIGDVFVGFSIGRDGRPANIVVRKSSGNPIYDNAARRVVGRLGRIGPVPSRAGQNYRVLLKLSYGFAPTAAADGQLANALDIERRAKSQRNLKIVTMVADEPRTLNH